MNRKQWTEYYREYRIGLRLWIHEIIHGNNHKAKNIWEAMVINRRFDMIFKMKMPDPLAKK